MKRKALALLLMVAMVISLLPKMALAGNFPDMPNDWSTIALENAVENGLLTGINGELMPKDNLTRAQMAVVINKAFGTTQKASMSKYTDVASNAWYFEDMAKAVHMKTFVGNGNKLNPESDITREEAFVVLAHAFKLSGVAEDSLDKFSDKAEISSWAKESSAALVKAGYITGSNGKLNPKQHITRAEFAQVMYNILKNYIRTSGTYTDVAKGNVMINVPDVTLKNLTIMGDLIIGDGVGDGNVILDSVKVTGRTVVRGGGINSIKIIGNSEVGSVIISKVDGNVRVVTEGNARLEVVYIDDGNDDVIIEGKIGTIEVTASNVPVVIQNAEVTSIVVTVPNASLTVSKGTTVETITISQAAPGMTITVDKGTNITNIKTEAPNTLIGGEGTVKNVSIQGNDCNINTIGTKYEVGIDITGTISGKTSIAGGVTGITSSGSEVVVPSTGGGTPTPTPTPTSTPTPTPTPTPIAVDAITITPAAISLTIGEANRTIVATVSPENATDKTIIWSSSDETVASVANGVVSPVTTGTAIITATSVSDRSITATVNVTVNAATTPITVDYYTALGDSITYGMSAEPGFGYAHLFYNNLKVINGDEGIELINLGIPGEKSSDLLNKLQTDIITKDAVSKAKVITISVGGNNLLSPVISALANTFQLDPTSATFAIDLASVLANQDQQTLNTIIAQLQLPAGLSSGAQQFGSDWGGIIGTIKTLAPQADIYVMTLYNPLNQLDPLYDLFEPAINYINEVISTPNTGYKVADVYTAFQSYQGTDPLINFSLFTGNLDPHPTTKGHEVIYQSHLVAKEIETPIETVVTVSAITATPAAITLTAGGTTETITKTISPANATNQNVTWSSSNEAVATVASGVVTPVAAGTATIRATSVADSTKFAETVVTVQAAVVVPPAYATTGTLTKASVTVTYGAIEVDAIAELDSEVDVTGSLGETGTATITWTIANYNRTAPGEYTATGVLTLPTGWTGTSAAITAKVTVAASVILGAAITGLDVPENVLQLGERITAIAFTTEAGADNWTSSNAAVATVDESTGVVTAVGAGTTTIAYTTSISNNINSKKVTVYVTAIYDDPAIGVVQVGEANVTPTSFIDAGEGETIAWVSSDTAKATVNVTTGVISAVMAGDTYISYAVIEDATGRVVACGSLLVAVKAEVLLVAAEEAVAALEAAIDNQDLSLEENLLAAEELATLACDTVNAANGILGINAIETRFTTAIGTLLTARAAFDALPDGWEEDNSYLAAKTIQTDGTPQSHSINEEGDEDWIKFSAQVNMEYQILTSNLLNYMDTYIELYNTDGTTLINSSDDVGDEDLASKITWICSTSGTYYVRIIYYNNDGTGQYDISISVQEVDLSAYNEALAAVTALEAAIDDEDLTVEANLLAAEGLLSSAWDEVYEVPENINIDEINYRLGDVDNIVTTARTAFDKIIEDAALLTAAEDAVAALEVAAAEDLTIEENLLTAEDLFNSAYNAVVAAEAITGIASISVRLDDADDIVTAARTVFDEITEEAALLTAAEDAVAALEVAITVPNDLTIQANLAVAEDLFNSAYDAVVAADAITGIDSITDRLTIAQNTITTARSTFDQATVNAVAAGITTITNPEVDATTLNLPAVTGHTVVIKSSSDILICDLNGKLAPKDEALDLQLVLTITNIATGKSADTIEITCEVPMTSQGEVNYYAELITAASLGTIFVGDAQTLLQKAQAILTDVDGYTVSVVATDGTIISAAGVAIKAGEGTISFTVTKDAKPVSAVTAELSITVGERQITMSAIEGVTPPAIGLAPVTTITETDQYTGTVTWNTIDATFTSGKEYTATITLAPKEGFYLTGMVANYFTVAGATSVTNAEKTGVVKATFPILVASAAELNSIRNNLGGNYIQVADIDLAGYTLDPIGTDSNPFSGSYNGDGYEISNLNISDLNELNEYGKGGYLGLFGISSGRIENVVLKNVSVIGVTTCIGGLVGRLDSGTIINCHVDGTITGPDRVGGLVGFNYNGTIQECSAAGIVNGIGEAYKESVGGLVGKNQGNIIKSFASVNVSSDAACTGGLVGSTGGGLIDKCYATGSVSTTEYWVGGLVGDNRIFNGLTSRITECYATGLVTGGTSGGLVGLNSGGYGSGSGIVERSYYDTMTTNQSDAGKGESKTTEEMKQMDTFVDWDFDQTWNIIEGANYPTYK